MPSFLIICVVWEYSTGRYWDNKDILATEKKWKFKRSPDLINITKGIENIEKHFGIERKPNGSKDP